MECQLSNVLHLTQINVSQVFNVSHIGQSSSYPLWNNERLTYRDKPSQNHIKNHKPLCRQLATWSELNPRLLDDKSDALPLQSNPPNDVDDEVVWMVGHCRAGADLREESPVKDAVLDKSAGMWTVTLDDNTTFHARVDTNHFSLADCPFTQMIDETLIFNLKIKTLLIVTIFSCH